MCYIYQQQVHCILNPGHYVYLSLYWQQVWNPKFISTSHPLIPSSHSADNSYGPQIVFKSWFLGVHIRFRARIWDKN